MGDDGSADGHLDVRILGALEVRRGGRLLPLGGRRQRGILACLLVSRASAQPTERIADAIWGEALPAAYLATLQTYIYHLRETLEPDRVKGSPAQVLVTTAGGYRLLVPDEDVDAWRFERLVADGQRLVGTDPARGGALLGEALVLWQDDVLSEFSDLQPVAREAARLEQVHQTALESWAAAELALGHHTALVPELGGLVSSYPLREGLHEQRMLALYRDGRQVEALAAYRQLRTTLDDELGVEPSPAIQQLHQRILRHDPTLVWESPRETVPVPGQRDNPAASVAREVYAAVPRGSPAQPPRSRWRRWTAVAVVVVLAVAMLTWTIVRAVTPDQDVPVPPNSVAMLSARGLDGDAIPVPGAVVALAQGAGSLWALDATKNVVLRLDPDTRRVLQTIPDVGGSPQSVAVDGNDVWVAGFDEGVVTRINTRTNTVITKIHVGIQPAAVVAGPGQVWVANSGDNTIQRIDPVSGRVGQPISVGTGPAGLALDGTTMWVANSRDASVTTLDTTSGERIVADKSVGAGPRSIWVTASDVWVANELGQSVTRISRETGRTTAISVEDGPTSVVVLDEDAWVSNESSASLSRIDTATNSVRRVYLDSAPRALVVADGHAWVSTGAFADVDHLGGTLVYTTSPGTLGPTLDPASAYLPEALAVLRPVYDGLLAFRATGGLASQTLVPDLATSVPAPSDGGRTYVFTIRSGVRYSSGEEVLATDFVRGVRRALLGEGNPGLYSAIVGAQGCIDAPAGPDSCSLSDGVTADDTTRRLTLRLSHPDPDFLYKLNYFVRPVPSGTPLTDSKMDTTIPGTGPYRLSEVAPDGSFTLLPNPHFRQWSHAAQPAGYPERIRYQVVPSHERSIADVIAGNADVVTVAPSDQGSLASHAQLVWRIATPATEWAYLNSNIQPFDDVRARQAINYAVDRRTFVTLRGGANAADPSCQLLPAGFPAYRRYCPYQTGAPTGDYLGPDLVRAKELVRESGTEKVPIIVRAFHGRSHSASLYDAFPDYLVGVLRSIGYAHVTVQDIPDEHVGTGPNDPEYRNYQIFTQFGWIADYPGPQTFYDQFSCSRPNFSHYCNPAIEAVAAEAAASAQVDPGHSLELWSRVDRMLTDDAAFVTLGRPHNAVLVSPRVRNIELSPGLGPMLSQMWVK